MMAQITFYKYAEAKQCYSLEYAFVCFPNALGPVVSMDTAEDAER